MPLYTESSLNLLRDRIDLVEVISAQIKLQRSGSSYKALCPFHEEKTPSFIVQHGAQHYHCFGCGAHGDAIAFLMNHLKMNFVDAVEALAERFQVPLERTGKEEEKKGPRKAVLKDALEKACQIYHIFLLHTKEGHEALKYLYQRGIDLSFIQAFRIGFAPSQQMRLYPLLEKLGFTDEVLYHAGLVSDGNRRDFFSDRILFPICDAMGSVIGFSGRKFKEETFGGKYINTPETLLFKKSHVLFGLNHSRLRIIKEHQAIIVEGQIDTLRLIHEGFDYTIAGQGTAFGESHVKELMQLGVLQTYLAFDGDEAGQQASVKVGNLFQKKGIGVKVVALPPKMDPDAFLREKGPDEFKILLENSLDYLTFLIQFHSKSHDLNIPAQKNQLVQTIATLVKGWEEPVMVYETLRKLAQMVSVPESVLGINQDWSSSLYLKKVGTVDQKEFNADHVLETDLLRWLILRAQEEPKLIQLVQINLEKRHFRSSLCYKFFQFFLEKVVQKAPCDLISLASVLESEEEQSLLAEIVKKKINLKKAEEGIQEVIHRLLMRQWMEERESIKIKIQSGQCSEEQVLELAKQFDQIKKNPPTVKII